jgi:hypothetical protein
MILLAEKNAKRIDTLGVRKQDLAKLPTPVPHMQSGVSIKYVYPELPQYIDAQQVSPSSSDRSMDKCVSTAEVV